MALTVLNNIASLTAENALSNTQANLQKTLTQLSTGLKINSGSDDAAGLSIASGLNANIAALTQSQQNATNGIGQLQTADGALSQVTTLLNRAVTLATEGSTSGLSTDQSTALNTEFQSILSEINQIGQTTNFNGQNVFNGNTGTDFKTTAGTSGTPLAIASATLAAGSVTTITDNADGSSYTYTASSGDTIATLNAAITANATGGVKTAQFADSGNNIELADGTDSLTVTTTDTNTLNGLTPDANASNAASVFISDSSTANSAANTEISTNISTLSATTLGLSSSGTNLDLSSAADAQTALTAINAAINTVSAQRGVIGASVNRLTAASSNMTSEVTNLQSAANSISDADVGKTVANMTQYNVLQSTGMAALQQSNQAQQAVLKLVQ